MAVKLVILAAGLGDFLWVLILLGSLAVWIINQIKSAQEEAGGQTKGRQPQPGMPDQYEDDWRAEEDEDEWDHPTGVSEHVQQHMDSHEIDDRSSHLGQLTHLDDTVDEHVHEVFDHQLGTLASEGKAEKIAPAASPTVGTAAAAGIAEVFADPDQLRRAIILQEILRRPQWD